MISNDHHSIPVNLIIKAGSYEEARAEAIKRLTEWYNDPDTAVLEVGKGFPEGTLLFFGVLDHGQVVINPKEDTHTFGYEGQTKGNPPNKTVVF